jgi:acyl dehydratase
MSPANQPGADYPATLQMRVGPVSPLQLALFAAASGDHNPLHLDADVARKAGFDRPVIHGMLTMAMAGRVFTLPLGAGSVRALRTRFTGVALVNETLDFTATLESAGAATAQYSLRATNAAGKEVLAGSATVARVGPTATNAPPAP